MVVMPSGDVDRVTTGEFGREGFDRRPRSLGTMPNDRDRCEESELPVLLDPVGHLVEQIRLETAVNGERCEHRVLDPSVILASKLDLGQMIREQRSVGHAIVRRRVGHAECIGGDGHEDLTRERVVPHVQIRNIGCDAMGVIAPNEAGEQSSLRFEPMLVGNRSHGATLRRLGGMRERRRRLTLSISALLAARVRAVLLGLAVRVWT